MSTEYTGYETLQPERRKGMNSLHKSTLIGCITGFVLIVVVAIGCHYISCHRQIEMAKLGYEQVQKAGSMDYVWHKVR